MWILLGPVVAAVPVGFEYIAAAAAVAAAAAYFESVTGWVVAIVDLRSGQRKDRIYWHLRLQCCRYYWYNCYYSCVHKGCFRKDCLRLLLLCCSPGKHSNCNSWPL